MEIAKGEENGAKFLAYLLGDNWVVEVTSPDGHKARETVPCYHRPVCGPDVAEVAQVEAVLDRLLKSAFGSDAPPA